MVNYSLNILQQILDDFKVCLTILGNYALKSYGYLEKYPLDFKSKKIAE